MNSNDKVEKRETTNKKSKNKNVKNRMVAWLVGGCLVATVGGTIYKHIDEKVNDAARALSTTNIECTNPDLYEDISGVYAYLAMLKYDDLSMVEKYGDIWCIGGDIFVTEDGKPFENNLSGKKVSVDVNGNNVVYQFTDDQEIIDGAEKKVDPISFSELLDGKFSLDKVENENNIYQYKFVPSDKTHTRL